MNQQELNQLLEDVRTIKRALTGDKEWGEDGLIKDVRSLKKWRQQVALKVAFYSGCATTIVFALGKCIDYLIAHH